MLKGSCVSDKYSGQDPLVLCLIHGYALGGGLQLALSCDIRVSTHTAELGLPAINESIILGLGTWRLARYIGLRCAKNMVTLGNNVDGEETTASGWSTTSSTKRRCTRSSRN